MPSTATGWLRARSSCWSGLTGKRFVGRRTIGQGRIGSGIASPLVWALVVWSSGRASRVARNLAVLQDGGARSNRCDNRAPPSSGMPFRRNTIALGTLVASAAVALAVLASRVRDWVVMTDELQYAKLASAIGDGALLRRSAASTCRPLRSSIR